MRANQDNKLKQIIQSNYLEIQEAFEKYGEMSVHIPYGFPNIENLASSLVKGNLYVIYNTPRK